RERPTLQPHGLGATPRQVRARRLRRLVGPVPAPQRHRRGSPMSLPCCCETPSPATADIVPRPRAARRRFLDLAGWPGPGVLLMLMPKCPMCLAAYVAVGTGLALSTSTAAYLRTALIILCLATLAYMTVRLIVGVVAGRRSEKWRSG